jgi:3',5'-cyclic AMP phosphodiesterase CpdA
MLGLLHISDLHFGRRASPLFADVRVLRAKIVAAVSPSWDEASDRVLIVSGDLVYQGDSAAFRVAESFIRELCSDLDVPTNNVVICPGNHDIVAGEMGKAFGPIDRLVAAFSPKPDRFFTSSSIQIRDEPWALFLVLNSAFHGDRHFGLVDMGALDAIELPPPDGRPRIAVVHHNLLGVFPEDTSALRNGYPLLKRLTEERFALVLHGHQHVRSTVRVGRGGYLAGAGSLQYLDPHVANQFSVVRFWNARWELTTYMYFADLDVQGRVGVWRATKTIKERRYS